MKGFFYSTMLGLGDYINDMAKAFLAGDYDMLKCLSWRAIDASNTNSQIHPRSTTILVHAGHTYLGIVELINNNQERCRFHFLESISIRKNNALHAGGPNSLLLDLYIRRYRDFDTALAYVKLSDKITSWLAKLLYTRHWKNSLKKRKLPDLRQGTLHHLVYDTSLFSDFIKEATRLRAESQETTLS